MIRHVENALPLTSEPNPLQTAKIIGRTGHCFHLRTAAGGIVRAEKADSCLLEPAVGDLVLLFAEPDDCFILSVLRKNTVAQAENLLSLNGPTRMHIQNGDLQLHADHNLGLSAGARIDAVSAEITATAEKATVQVERCSFWGRMLNIQAEVIKTASKTMAWLTKSWTLQTDNAVRYVKEHDETQAGSARYLTGETLTMQSKNAVHTAEELVSINGEQINLS